MKYAHQLKLTQNHSRTLYTQQVTFIMNIALWNWARHLDIWNLIPRSLSSITGPLTVMQASQVISNSSLKSHPFHWFISLSWSHPVTEEKCAVSVFLKGHMDKNVRLTVMATLGLDLPLSLPFPLKPDQMSAARLFEDPAAWFQFVVVNDGWDGNEWCWSH